MPVASMVVPEKIQDLEKSTKAKLFPTIFRFRKLKQKFDLTPDSIFAFFKKEYNRERKKQTAWTKFALSIVSAGLTSIAPIVGEDIDIMLEKLDVFLFGYDL